MTPASLTVSAREAAELLGQGVSSIYDGVRRGDVPNVGVGKAVRIPRAWLESRLRAAGATLPAKFETVGSGTFV